MKNSTIQFHRFQFVATLCTLLALMQPASAAPTAYQTAVLADTPFLYYELGEASGTTVADVSGNGYTGSYVNSPTLGVPGDSLIGPSDTAVTFNGTSQYVSCPAGAESFGSFLGTSSYEFVLAATSTSIAGMIAGDANAGSTTSYQVLLNEAPNGTLTANTCRIFIRDNSNHNIQASFTNATLFNGNYHHLVWTYNGTTVAAYLDGVAQAIGTPAIGTAAPSTFSAFTFLPYFAAYSNKGGTTANYAAVTLDEVALYKTVLSPAQIATHYAAVGINKATWVGGTDANFSTAANWSPAALASLNTLVFTNVATTTALNNDETAFTFTGIIFTNLSSAYTITGNPFTLSGAIANSSATAAQSIADNIALTNWTTVNWSAPVSDAGGGTTLGGIISGPYGITKSGAGTVTLSGADTYTGPTTNNAGTLAVNGSLAGNVVVNSGATLAGTGTIGGAATVNSGAILAPGNSGVGTLNSGSLTLNSGAINNFEFSGVANDKVINTGTLTVNGGAFNLYQPGGTTAFNTPATYTLIQYTGSDPALDSTWTTASGSNPHVLNPVATYTYAFTAASGALKLTIASTAAVNHVWTNNVSGNWSQASNWSPSKPQNAGDIATLGVGSSLQTVTLDSSLSVGFLGLTNANSFVIANAGNTLTLDNTNGGATVNVSGGTANVIQTKVSLNDNATINVGAGDSLAVTNVLSSTATTKTLTVNGVGKLALSGGNTYGPAQGTVGTTLSGAGILQVGSSTALAAGDLSVSASGILQAGAAGLNLGNNIIIGSGVTLTEDNNGNNLTLGGVVSGGGGLSEMDLANAYSLTLNGVDTYTGGTTINAGTLTIGGSGQLGSGVYAGAITNNGIFTYNSTAAQTLSGIISGTGALNQNGSGTLTLTGVNSYTGNTTISAGTLTISGTGQLGGGAYAGAIINNGIFNYNSTAIQLLSGGVAGSGVLNQGAGTLTLSGADTYTGGTVVSGNGSLTFANNAGTTPATGTVTLNGFGSVAMTGALPNAAVNGTNSINGGGNGTASVGTLALNGTVTLSVGGTGAFDLTGTITGSGTINLTNRPSSGGGGGMQLRFNGTTGDSGLVLNLGTTNNIAVNNTATAITLGGLMGGQYSQLQGGTAAMTYTIGEANLNTEFDGIIANGTAGATSIAKVGTGVLNLTGANTYTGTTTVTNGTLLLNGSTAGSGVVVNTAGILGGAGTIGDPTVTIGSGGHTLPGGNLGNTSGVTTTLSGSLVYNTGAEADFNLNNVYNAGNDHISVAGNLNGNGASVGIYVSNGTLDTNHDYVLITASGTVASGFAATPNWLGSTPANPQYFSVVTVGNSVVLHNSPITVSSVTVTPNPVPRGQRVTVSVTAATGVAGGSISSVVMDASAVHAGATSVSLNSTNPPTSNTYTNSVTVDSTLAAGSYNLTVTITDSASNVKTLTIPLTVNGLSQVWNGNGGDNNWSTTANWVGGQPPQLGDYATFAGINRPFPNMQTGYTLSGLTFNTDAGSFDIMSSSDSTLAMSGGVTNNSLNVQTFDAAVALALNGVQTFNTASGSIVINGVIEDGSSQGSLVKTGNGTLLLPNVNLYTGNTIVNGGVLSISSYLNVENSPLLILNGGDLMGSNAVTKIPDFFADIGIGATSGSVPGTALIDAASGQEFTIFGHINSAGNTGANNLIVNSGAGNNGTVFLQDQDGAGDHFSGSTIISNGWLQVAAALSLQNSTLNYNNQGGVLVFDSSITATTLGGLSGAQNLGLTNLSSQGVNLTVGNNNASTTYSGNMSDAGLGGSLTKSGTGTLTLTGTNTYTAATTLAGGTLTLTNGGQIVSAGAVTINNGGGSTFRVSGGSLSAASMTMNNNNVGFIQTSGASSFTNNVNFAANNGDNGDSLQILGGTFTANSLTSGRTGLILTAQPAAGQAAGGQGIFISNAVVTITNTLGVGHGNSSTSMRMDGGVLNVGGTTTITCNNTRWSVLDINGGAFTCMDTNGPGVQIGGGFAGVDALFLIRAGTVSVHQITFGDVATQTSGTDVLNLTGGTLYIGAGGVIITNPAPLFGTSITMGGGTVGASADWVSALPITLTSNLTFQAADIANVAHNITLSNALSGAGGLTKTGNGTLALAAMNTYTSGTTISNGVLALIGAGSIAGSTNVDVTSGAQLDVSAVSPWTLVSGQTLKGGGTVTGASVIAAAGSRITPGESGLGTLTFSGALSLNGTTVMKLNRAGSPNSDRIVANANSIIAGGTLTVTNVGAGLQAGDTFQLFSTNVTGSFVVTNLPAIDAANNLAYTWTNKLAVNGTIAVLTATSLININPPTIQVVAAGGTLNLGWPTNLGWILQTNSTDLANSNAWFPYPGSTSVTNVAITMNPGKTNVFFRMVKP